MSVIGLSIFRLYANVEVVWVWPIINRVLEPGECNEKCVILNETALHGIIKMQTLILGNWTVLVY